LRGVFFYPQKQKILASIPKVQAYNVTVDTGDEPGSGTTSEVFLTIHGT